MRLQRLVVGALHLVRVVIGLLKHVGLDTRPVAMKSESRPYPDFDAESEGHRRLEREWLSVQRIANFP